MVRIELLKESIEKSALESFGSDRIKKYYEFWYNYIGNDGNSNPLHIKDITQEDNRFRLQMGQYTYSILKNLVFINESINEVLNLDFERSDHIVRFEKNFYSFIHSFFNIHELINGLKEHPTKPIGQIDLSPHQGFISFRNEIAHSLRPPYRIYNNKLTVPTNFEVFINDPSSKSNPKVWSLYEYNIDAMNYEPFEVLGFTYFERGWTLLNDVISNLLTFMNSHVFFNNHFVDWGDPKLISISPSGSIESMRDKGFGFSGYSKDIQIS